LKSSAIALFENYNLEIARMFDKSIHLIS
jgi:histone H4